MAEPPPLFTLGYEGRTLEEFVRLLRAERVGAVLDVRDVPWSHKPGFAKKPLAEGLEAAGIRYLHAGFAGNPKRLRSQASDTDDALRLYAAHLDASPEVLAEFDALVSDLHTAGIRVCLLCLERDPAQCHRAVLAARWAKRGPGRTVRHLRFAEVRRKKGRR
ncbi:MAG TPA: DUF488 domain-containing protein [Candidatus Polarisedimenticolaceae bacterium]|nr:DUF488 domain-containing protein [Candidatus Polarisedimenticolaceae bacterium]